MTTGLVLTVDAIAGQNIGLVAEEGNVRLALAAVASTLTPALSSFFWVDRATTTPLDQQNGNESRPYSTLLAAVTAHAAGGTFLIVPGDYSAEVVPVLAGNAANGWAFIGADFGTWPEGLAGPPATFPATFLPNLTIGAGLTDSTRIVLRSVRIDSLSTIVAGALQLCDVQFLNGCFVDAADTPLDFRAQRCYFNSGGVGGGGLGLAQFDDCGFLGSQSIVTALDTLQLTRCYGETSLNFSGPAGTTYIDLWTRGRLNFPVITNGAVLLSGLGPTGVLPEGVAKPDLTASLANAQAQIDDIVAAGVILGFWTDNRVP
jgi:hypothetical protein